jgi:hypothetical protein
MIHIRDGTSKKGNYRPFAFIDMNTKIVNKMLQIKLSYIQKYVIHHCEEHIRRSL